MATRSVRPPHDTHDEAGTVSLLIVRLIVFISLIALGIGLLVLGYDIAAAAWFVVLVAGAATTSAMRLTSNGEAGHRPVLPGRAEAPRADDPVDEAGGGSDRRPGDVDASA